MAIRTKAIKGDIVIHNGRPWTVLARDYDYIREQSYYLLRIGKDKRNSTTKWARSDTFSMT